MTHFSDRTSFGQTYIRLIYIRNDIQFNELFNLILNVISQLFNLIC